MIKRVFNKASSGVKTFFNKGAGDAKQYFSINGPVAKIANQANNAIDTGLNKAGNIARQVGNYAGKAGMVLNSLTSLLAPMLGPEIGEKHDFDDSNEKFCKAYHRDRGEDLEENTVYSSVSEMVKNVHREILRIISSIENWSKYLIELIVFLCKCIRNIEN
jgi:hypothetical protein